MNASRSRSIDEKELRKALHKLEVLNAGMERSEAPSLLELHVSQGQVTSYRKSIFWKAIDLIRSFFSPRHRQEQRTRKARVKEEILAWTDVIKSQFDQLEHLRQGNREQRQLANRLLKVVRRYNRWVRRLSEPPHGLSERVSRYFVDQTAHSLDKELSRTVIPLPAHPFRSRRVLSGRQAPSVESLFRSAKKSVKPTQSELDAFRMKGVRLLGQVTEQELGPNLLEMVRATPVESRQGRGLAHSNLIALSQTVSTFPGETIRLNGAFKRLGNREIPLPDSFSALTESKQTGFPHPSQASGWSLSESLLPTYPLRMEELDLVRRTLERKWALAKALLPGGHLLPKAKHWLKIRHQALQMGQYHLLPLHKQLLEQLLPNHVDCIATYMQLLSQQDRPLLALGRGWQVLDERLLHPMAQQTSQQQEEGYRRFRCRMERRVEKADTEWRRSEANLLYALAECLFKECQALVALYQSEKGAQKMPSLSPFAERLQILSWAQLLRFIEAMGQLDSRPYSAEKMELSIAAELQADSALLQGQPDPVEHQAALQLLAELNAYYRRRVKAGHLECNPPRAPH